MHHFQSMILLHIYKFTDVRMLHIEQLLGSLFSSSSCIQQSPMLSKLQPVRLITKLKLISNILESNNKPNWYLHYFVLNAVLVLFRSVFGKVQVDQALIQSVIASDGLNFVDHLLEFQNFIICETIIIPENPKLSVWLAWIVLKTPS